MSKYTHSNARDWNCKIIQMKCKREKTKKPKIVIVSKCSLFSPLFLKQKGINYWSLWHPRINASLSCICTGVGALYVRRRPRVRLEPLQNGGGQERGLRSGTVPTPLAVGLGAACSIAQQEMEVKNEPAKLCWIKSVWRVFLILHATCVQYDHERISMLANHMVQKIMSAIPDVILNGDPEQRYSGIVTQK